MSGPCDNMSGRSVQTVCPEGSQTDSSRYTGKIESISPIPRTKRALIVGQFAAGRHPKLVEASFGVVEHELQVTSQGEKLPTFADPLLHAFRTKTMNSRRNVDPFTSCQELLQRLLEDLGAWIASRAVSHGRPKIVGADKDGVDSRDGVNLLGLANRVDVLALQHDEDFVVPRA